MSTRTSEDEYTKPRLSYGTTKHVKISPLYTIISTNAKNLHLYRTHGQCVDTIEKWHAPDD